MRCIRGSCVASVSYNYSALRTRWVKLRPLASNSSLHGVKKSGECYGVLDAKRQYRQRNGVENMAKETTKKKQPVKRLYSGGVACSIWVNENKDKQKYFSATINGRYKNEKDEYVNSDSYMENQILHLAHIANEAAHWCLVHRDMVYQPKPVSDEGCEED